MKMAPSFVSSYSKEILKGSFPSRLFVQIYKRICRLRLCFHHLTLLLFCVSCLSSLPSHLLFPFLRQPMGFNLAWAAGPPLSATNVLFSFCFTTQFCMQFICPLVALSIVFVHLTLLLPPIFFSLHTERLLPNLGIHESSYSRLHARTSRHCASPTATRETRAALISYYQSMSYYQSIPYILLIPWSSVHVDSTAHLPGPHQRLDWDRP